MCSPFPIFVYFFLIIFFIIPDCFLIKRIYFNERFFLQKKHVVGQHKFECHFYKDVSLYHICLQWAKRKRKRKRKKPSSHFHYWMSNQNQGQFTHKCRCHKFWIDEQINKQNTTHTKHPIIFGIFLFYSDGWHRCSISKAAFKLSQSKVAIKILHNSSKQNWNLKNWQFSCIFTELQILSSLHKNSIAKH